MASRKIFSVSQLGAAIRTRRKELGLTQAQLCEYCGCSIRFLSELERGKQTAEVGKVLHVVHMLSMDLNLIDR